MGVGAGRLASLEPKRPQRGLRRPVPDHEQREDPHCGAEGGLQRTTNRDQDAEKEKFNHYSPIAGLELAKLLLEFTDAGPGGVELPLQPASQCLHSRVKFVCLCEHF